MTEELKALLEYQELDREVFRVETELRRSDEVKSVSKLQNDVQSVSQTIFRLDKEAGQLMADVERWEKEADELPAEEIRSKIAACTTLEQLAPYERQLNKLNETYNGIQKELTRANMRLKEIYDEVKRLNERGRKLSEEYQKAYDIYRKKASRMQEVVRPQKEKMDALRPRINPKHLAAYKNLRDKRRFPPFVAYHDGNCGGCGMNIGAEMALKMKGPGDLAECPSCHRVLYWED